MTYQFGGAVESRRGQVRFLALVLAIAILSNLGQYLWNGPIFGGMSGVVYGLFGYIWVKSRFEPQIGLSMPPSTVAWLIGWFFLCYTPLLGNVANTAHLVGLIVGASVSYFPVLWRQAMK
jgi:GlpG protein